MTVPQEILVGDRCIIDRDAGPAGDAGGGMVCTCMCGRTWWEGDSYTDAGGRACRLCAEGRCDHPRWPENLVRWPDGSSTRWPA